MKKTNNRWLLKNKKTGMYAILRKKGTAYTRYKSNATKFETRDCARDMKEYDEAVVRE